MNVLMGFIGLLAVLGYTLLNGHNQPFTGVLYLPALVLLVLAPWFITLMSYSFEDLKGCAVACGRAFRFRAARSRQALFEDLCRFASEMRAGRPAQALEAADASEHPVLRQLAPLVVRQYAPQELQETAHTAMWCQASALRRSEEVLNTLARVAPAAGLVGTVMGLIALLRDLAQFDQLGPSMALALLCTLYGLLLANGVYQPMARMIRTLATVRMEEARLLGRALALVGVGKPVADIRRLFEVADTTPGATSPARVETPAEPGVSAHAG